MKKMFVNFVGYNFKALLLMLLCCANFAYAQVTDELQSNFQNVQKAAYQERIYVHVNKQTYLPGETIWFKIYNTDGSNNKPSSLSKVAYAEVLDRNHTPVLQAKILMIDGTGDGSFELPASLNTGNYELRAYTNWMKNFGAEYYFYQTITIINPQKELVKDDDDPVKYDIQFFPEGGHLVTGLSSKVAFKITASDGAPVNANGVIINQRNDTVTRFSTLKFGMGSFQFLPKAQSVYKAVLHVNGKPVSAIFPQIDPAGYTMATKYSDKNLDVLVNTLGVTAKNIYLLIHTSNMIKVAQIASLKDGSADFVIDKTKLSDGVNHITLFNEQKQPVCERLIFFRPKKRLNIIANTDALQYPERKKVIVNILSQNQAANNIPANLSMSVYRLDSLQHVGHANIASYLWLSSALKGRIESPDYYFDNNTAESNEALDNLLLSQGWTQFDWTNVIANKTPSYSYIPEYVGPLITANVINTATNIPAANVYGYLTIPGKYHQFYVSKSDSTGKLIFNTRGSIGSREIILKTNPLLDSIYRIDILSFFSEDYRGEKVAQFQPNTAAYPSLNDDNINSQVNYFFAPKTAPLLQIDTGYFYGKPPYRYNLDDYTRFKTIAEVIHEYVRFVSVTYPNGQPHLRMSYNKALLPNETVALVDGEPIFNAGDIYKLDPLKIKRIDVINSQYVYGPKVFDGLISLTTYNGDHGNINLDPKALTMDYEGLELKRKFYSPVYDTDAEQKNTLPDFRTALLWAPNINTDQQGDTNVIFYTGDKPGKYVGIIEGLSANGEAGYKQFSFEVKK